MPIAHPVFDCEALYDVLHERRTELGLGSYELADRLREQSAAHYVRAVDW